MPIGRNRAQFDVCTVIQPRFLPSLMRFCETSAIDQSMRLRNYSPRPALASPEPHTTARSTRTPNERWVPTSRQILKHRVSHGAYCPWQVKARPPTACCRWVKRTFSTKKQFLLIRETSVLSLAPPGASCVNNDGDVALFPVWFLSRNSGCRNSGWNN